MGGLTTSCLAEVGVGMGWGEGGVRRAPSHLAQQQGVGCTSPIPNSNPFGGEMETAET